MTTGKTIALTRWTFVGKVMSLPFNKLSRVVIAFLPKSKCLLISWLQSPSTVIFGTGKENQVLTKWQQVETKWWPNKEKWPSKITTQNTKLKHTHINLAVLIRHSLKYKKTVSQKTYYTDTELQIQVRTE